MSFKEFICSIFDCTEELNTKIQKQQVQLKANQKQRKQGNPKRFKR
ncbi:MAG: hypothetical protein AB1467_06860 [Candidatus Diapherotrites archaeon]